MTVYKNCEKIIRLLKREGWFQITERDLLPFIMRFGGSDPRTIKKYMMTFVGTGLIYPMKDSSGFSIGIYALSGKRKEKSAKVEKLTRYVK